MKKNLLIRFFALLLIWLSPVVVLAAEPDLIITTEVANGAITVCGNDADVTVKIKNNTANSVTLNGLNLFSGTTSLTVTGFPGTWKNSGCATGYTYCPVSATSVISGQTLSLIFKVKATCAVIAAIESGQQNFFDVKVLYNTSRVALQQTVNPVNILYPNYSVSVSPDAGVVSYGETITRTVTVCNMGIGFNPTINLTHTHDAGMQLQTATYEILDINGNPIGSGTPVIGGTATTHNYTINDNIPEVPSDLTDQKRCYVITETFKITGCNLPQIASNYSTSWGCNSTTCKTTSKSSLLLIKAQNPVLSVVERSFIKPDFCTPGKIEYQIKNAGVDPAGDIIFDLPFSSNVSFVNGKISLDPNFTSSVSIPNSSASPYHLDISALTQLANPPSANVSIINGRLYLNPPYPVFIKFDVIYACPTNVGGVTYTIGAGTVNYKDVCGISKTPVAIDKNESIISWSTCGARFTPDMKVGETQKLKICYMATMTDVPCENGSYKATFTLPQGLVYQANTATVDGVYYPNVSVSGNTVTLVDIPNYTDLKCFEIGVKLTCDGTAAGSPIIKEFLSNFKLTYQCDKNNNCCDIVAGVYDFKIFGDMTTCPGVTSPNCLQTLSFTTKRNTFGTDPVSGQPVTASTPGIALDRAYPCDEILACAKGKWISTGATLAPSNVFIDVEFEQPSSILQFVSGTIEIVDANGGSLTSCAVTAPTPTSNGTKYKHRFVLPSCASTITINPNYGINLCAKYKVADDASIGKGPIISVFRTTYGYKNGTTDVTCLGKGDQMTLIRPINKFELTTSGGVLKPQCDPVKVTLTWTTKSCFEDDFPNEIRNMNQFTSYKFNYPTGFNLQDVYYYNATCNGTAATLIKGGLPANVNCTQPFTLAPSSFPLIDKCSNFIQQRLEFNLQPTCLSPETASTSIEITNKNFPGTTCEKTEVKTLTTPLNTNQPKLVVNTMPPNIDGIEEISCWTVRVSNASYEFPANQVNLKFPTCSGITVLSIADITNGGYEDLTANFSNGQLPIGNFYGRDEKIYQVCGRYKCTNNSCPVEVNYSCGVPYYCASTTVPQVCTASSTTMSATPKDGLLQTVFNVPTDITDVCHDIEMSYVVSNVGQGNIYDVFTKITSLPTCWSIVPGSVCRSSTRPGARPVCDPDFDLLTGTGVSLGVKAPGPWGTKISFTVRTTCDLLNCTSAKIVMQTTGKKACGDVITNTFTSKNLVFNSKPDYSYIRNIVAQPFTYCTSTDSSGVPPKDGISSVFFTLTVDGPFPNTTNDVMVVNMPAGFQYVVGSFVAQTAVGGVTVTGYTNSCTSGSKVNLKINSAVGIGGVIKFKMNVSRCDVNLACGSYPFSLAITQNDTRTCTDPALNCIIGDGKVTLPTNFNVDVKKPTFAVSNVVELTSLALCNASGQVKFKLNNTGGLPLGASDAVPIDIYCSTTPNPSIVCGASLPTGVTLLKTITATPGANASIDVTTTITNTCKTGPYLFFRVGVNCASTVCFCPTTYCDTLKRPKVDFTVSNICKGSNACIVNKSTSLGQAATYTIKIKSGTTTLYTLPNCTAANCSTSTFCVTPAQLNLNAGTYNWEMTQTTSCGTITVTRPFTVNALPTVAVSPTAATICPNVPVTLTASGASTYSWTPVSGLSSSTNSVVSANPPATTTYTVTGTSAQGCIATKTVKVTVNTVPTVSMPNVELCSGDCFMPNFTAGITGGTPFVSGTTNYYQYSVTGPNGFTFSCSTLPGASCATGTPFCTAGTYTVSAWGSNNCKGTGTFTIGVLNMPILTPMNTSLYPGQCVDASTLIGYNPANLKSGESITIVNNTNGSTVINCTAPGCAFLLCPTQNTTYTATFKKVGASGKVCQKSVTFTITMKFAVKVVTTCTPSSGPCSGTAQAIVTIGAAPYTYLWSNGATTETATGLCAGNYTVKVTDATGAQLTTPATITSGTVSPITGTTDFANLQPAGTIKVNGMAGWTNATLYLKCGISTVCDDYNNPDYSAPFTSTNVDANGNINVNTLVPDYNRYQSGYTFAYIVYTNGCDRQIRSRCFRYDPPCYPVCGTLSTTVTPVTQGLYTQVPAVRLCMTDPFVINWSCNQYLSRVKLYIEEIYDPTNGGTAPAVPNTKQVYPYKSATAINVDLKTLYPFVPNRWYRIQVAGEAWACNESGATSVLMFLKTTDCSKCSTSPGNFTVGYSGLPSHMDAPETATLISFSNKPVTTYEWLYAQNDLGPIGTGYFSSTNTPDTDFSVIVTSNPNNTGNYITGYVTLRVTDANGCTATSFKTTRFKRPGDGDGHNLVNTTDVAPVNNEEGNKIDFQVMPNPNNGTFTVFIDLDSEKDVAVYDMTGKIVFERSRTKEQTFNINISHLAKGIYLVRVSDTKNYELKKVVIQ